MEDAKKVAALEAIASALEGINDSLIKLSNCTSYGSACLDIRSQSNDPY